MEKTQSTSSKEVKEKEKPSPSSSTAFSTYVGDQLTASNVHTGSGDNITNNYTSADSINSPTQLRTPVSISGILKPMKNLKETRAFRNIQKKVKDQRFQILHCHGVPGSGKSQAVLKLSENFFRDNASDGKFIGWHIRCLDDIEQNVKERLQKLAEELQRSGWILKDRFYSINDHLDTGGAGELIRTLFDCNAHILILIEDPQSKCKRLLYDLCRQLSAKSTEIRECKFHLYLTSHRKQILDEDEMNEIAIYQPELIKGFNQTEAIDFLNEASVCAAGEIAAKMIFQRFSGLPLGLRAAREFCKHSRINYNDYLHFLKEDERELEEEERKRSTVIESSEKHVFQAIVMLFKPDEKDRNTMLHWKILCCLSYFHHDCVPLYLIERCCYLLVDESTRKRKSKMYTGQLITRLKDFSMCSKISKYKIRLHQVVLNAFRVHHQASVSEKCMSVKIAIEVLCSLVSKDLRKKGACSRLSKLRPHMQSLLNHVDPVDDFFSDEDLLLYKALLSQLCDVTATILSGASPSSNEESNKYFEKAFQLLWEEYSQQVVSDCDCDVGGFSKTIVEQSATKGQLLPQQFVLDYASKLFYCFDEAALHSAKSVCGEKFKKVENLLQTHKPKKELIEQLQKCNVFLQDQDYCRIFYAERLASILHSWSRSILDADPNKVKEDTKSAWRSSLSRSVSIQCRLLHEVPLLCEWLSVSGSIAIWLKQKRGSDYAKKVSDLRKEILLADQKDCSKTYENGLVVKLSFSYLRRALDQFLVRVNTRRKELNRDEIEECDKLCHELYILSLATVDTFSNSPRYLIYCAKYYASQKNFEKLLICFGRYFALTSHQSYNNKSYPWAVYNYARALQSHFSTTSHSSRQEINDRDDAIHRCQNVLNSNAVLNEDLNERLKSVLQALKEQRIIKYFRPE